MAPKVKLQGIVLDCTEPSRLAKFYADLLNWKAQDGQYDFSTVSAPEESIILSPVCCYVKAASGFQRHRRSQPNQTW
ncbi:VOC family protein [Kineothrix sedimenti]|uniref:VOC family protein n=1 Tax=Kineothrix sedimenti TaxID=3123317 RepID=UPI003CC82402